MVTVDDVVKAMLEQGDEAPEISDEQAARVASLVTSRQQATKFHARSVAASAFVAIGVAAAVFLDAVQQVANSVAA